MNKTYISKSSDQNRFEVTPFVIEQITSWGLFAKTISAYHSYLQSIENFDIKKLLINLSKSPVTSLTAEHSNCKDTLKLQTCDDLRSFYRAITKRIIKVRKTVVINLIYDTLYATGFFTSFLDVLSCDFQITAGKSLLGFPITVSVPTSAKVLVALITLQVSMQNELKLKLNSLTCDSKEDEEVPLWSLSVSADCKSGWYLNANSCCKRSHVSMLAMYDTTVIASELQEDDELKKKAILTSLSDQQKNYSAIATQLEGLDEEHGEFVRCVAVNLQNSLYEFLTECFEDRVLRDEGELCDGFNVEEITSNLTNNTDNKHSDGVFGNIMTFLKASAGSIPNALSKVLDLGTQTIVKIGSTVFSVGTTASRLAVAYVTNPALALFAVNFGITLRTNMVKELCKMISTGPGDLFAFNEALRLHWQHNDQLFSKATFPNIYKALHEAPTLSHFLALYKCNFLVMFDVFHGRLFKQQAVRNLLRHNSRSLMNGNNHINVNPPLNHEDEYKIHISRLGNFLSYVLPDLPKKVLIQMQQNERLNGVFDCSKKSKNGQLTVICELRDPTARMHSKIVETITAIGKSESANRDLKDINKIILEINKIDRVQSFPERLQESLVDMEMAQLLSNSSTGIMAASSGVIGAIQMAGTVVNVLVGGNVDFANMDSLSKTLDAMSGEAARRAAESALYQTGVIENMYNMVDVFNPVSNLLVLPALQQSSFIHLYKFLQMSQLLTAIWKKKAIGLYDSAQLFDEIKLAQSKVISMYEPT